MPKLTESWDKININGFSTAGEPLWRHTSFAVGGPADFYAEPSDEEDVRTLVRWAADAEVPVFVLGGGTNLLVADGGYRGLVLQTSRFDAFRIDGEVLIVGAGVDVSRAAWVTGSAGFGGLDFLFGMPGSVGGAVWMNARCYGEEIGNRFVWAEVISPQGEVRRVGREDGIWDYKVSPFQGEKDFILRIAVALTPGNPAELRAAMREKRNDRLAKGHYRSPCAGSAFKNNRSFGDPSGRIIDRCGLKGMRRGGAAVSEWHGNIFINDRGASSRDISGLLEEVARRVEKATGFRLEPEVITVGDGV